MARVASLVSSSNALCILFLLFCQAHGGIMEESPPELVQPLVSVATTGETKQEELPRNGTQQCLTPGMTSRGLQDEWEEEAAAEEEEEAEETTFQSPLSGFVNHVVDSYRAILDDMVVGQMESWNFVSTYDGVDESRMGTCPRITPKVRSAPSHLSPQELQDFTWDEDADISTYLDSLHRGCSQDASSPENYTKFKAECWDVLKDLIYAPRCTTRFDSRVSCTKGQAPDMATALSDAETILEGHFEEDTLNVVIIGAGPTGLFLANSLAETNNLPSRVWRPKIRVLVMENRVQATGVKQAYVRNWQTTPNLDDTVEAVDRRLGNIFSSLTDGSYFVLPVIGIETLLLLSSRDLGVKFLYGNITDFIPYLSQQPNLMVFDATGHRHDSLVRGSNCPLPEPTPGIQSTTAHAEEEVYPWEPSGNEDLDGNYFDYDQYQILDSYDLVFNIASKGDVLYPVTRQGFPYATWWLSVREVPYTEDYYNLDHFWNRLSHRTELCQTCALEEGNEDHDELEEYNMCRTLCLPNQFYDTGLESFYREDILNQIIGDMDNVWLDTRGAGIHLSEPQAKHLSAIIRELGYHNNTNGMPMDRLPLSKLAEEEAFREDDELMYALKTLMKVENKTDSPPRIAVFQHRPYVYHNGIIQGDLFGPTTPMLRIGETLATGDPRWATGLATHLTMVRNLVCRMRDEDDKCPKDPEPDWPEEADSSESES